MVDEPNVGTPVTSRRAVLGTVLGGSVASLTGCLRLTEDEATADPTVTNTEQSRTDTGTRANTTTAAQRVDLTRLWSLPDLSGQLATSNVVAWRYDDSVLVGQYRQNAPDRLVRVTADGDKLWETGWISDTPVVT
ncbi:hypothetical protein [Haloarcula marina]|uniref:hypothetical protein n=1 Tax=Haloarcula marina TaxID=2961574 RepID=UPI0020B808C5|nr:hypothetical protein [Halomicroarcula marina]